MLSGTQAPTRVAIVHDWLPLYGGAERVLEQIIHVFPQADLFSMIDAIPLEHRAFLRGKPVKTSFIQRLPGAHRRYRSYLPLMPLAVEQFDLREYDLVVSISYAVAKGVIISPDQMHICYCCSPIRYAWDLQAQYLNEAGLNRGIKGWVARALLHYIRIWDTRTSNGVDHFLTLSRYIARRIKKIYRRESRVIYPPVDMEKFSIGSTKDGFYLAASRMVPYKRLDLIAEAFSTMPNRRLKIVGDGPQLERVRLKAGRNVELLGFQKDGALLEQMQRARAFVFAAEEDFGIVAVEAQACGTPVIAYGRGGACDTVIDGVTGIFFGEQTVSSICEAVERFEQASHTFDPLVIRQAAERFSVPRFRAEFEDFVQRRWSEFQVSLKP